MNPHEKHRGLLDSAQAVIPDAVDGQSLFRAPWQARVFALMVALVNNGHIPWRAFQQRLAAEIEKAGNSPESMADTETEYFDCWLAAAERTLVEEGFVASRDMDEKIALIRATLAGPAADPATNPAWDQ